MAKKFLIDNSIFASIETDAGNSSGELAVWRMARNTAENVFLLSGYENIPKTWDELKKLPSDPNRMIPELEAQLSVISREKDRLSREAFEKMSDSHYDYLKHVDLYMEFLEEILKFYLSKLKAEKNGESNSDGFENLADGKESGLIFDLSSEFPKTVANHIQHPSQVKPYFWMEELEERYKLMILRISDMKKEDSEEKTLSKLLKNEEFALYNPNVKITKKFHSSEECMKELDISKKELCLIMKGGSVKGWKLPGKIEEFNETERVRLYNIHSETERSWESYRACYKDTGLDHNKMKAILKGGTRKGWSLPKWKLREMGIEEIKAFNTKWMVLQNTITGDFIEFESMAACRRGLNLSNYAMDKLMNGGEHSGWKIISRL